MEIKNFKRNVITQKNVINHMEFVHGAYGTNTEKTEPTNLLSGWKQLYLEIVAQPGTPTTKNDNIGDWDDEGTCD